MNYKKPSRNLITDIKILAVIIVSSVLIYAMGMIASLPTQNHRDVTRELTNLMTPKDGGFPDLSVLDSPRYKELEKSPENTYTLIASAVNAAVQIAAFIAIVYLTYRYILQRRVHKNTSGATVILVTLGSVIAGFVFSFISSAYTGIATPLRDTLFFTLLSLILTSIMTILATLIVHTIYKRKHGFLDE